MGYAKITILFQGITIILNIIYIGMGIACVREDKKWNQIGDQYKALGLFFAYNIQFNYENYIVMFENLQREVGKQDGALVLYFIVVLCSIANLYLCFLINNIYYRKYFNLVFHILAGIVTFIGVCVYITSFSEIDHTYVLHYDTIYENAANRPTNPCRLNFKRKTEAVSKLKTKFANATLTDVEKTLLQIASTACHSSWTKVFAIYFTFINIFLYFLAAFIIAFFVEEEDGTELLNKENEMIATGGPLPPLSSLTPLPYYCRPLEKSPTTKRKGEDQEIKKKKKESKSKNEIEKGNQHRWNKNEEDDVYRVEVSENWTDPRATYVEKINPRMKERRKATVFSSMFSKKNKGKGKGEIEV